MPTAGTPIVAEDFVGQMDENTADIAVLEGAVAAQGVRITNLESHNPTCRFRRSSPLSVTVNTPTDYGFDTEDWDNGPFHSGSSPDFIVPLAGVYQIAAGGTWQADTAGFRQVQLHINGGEVYALHSEGDGDEGPPVCGTFPLLFLDALDEIKLVAFYNAAGGLPATLTLGLDITITYVMSVPT